MAVSVDQFGKALIASGLMAPDEVKALWNAFPADGRPKDGAGFARHLVDLKKLTDFQAKELLEGRGSRLVMDGYSLLAKIGEGGMGQVYKARHRRMERIVALKVMSTAAMKDEASVKRFQREVRAAAKLEHPNIVTAYDSGEAGSVKYLVMQFVDGGDLAALVKKNGPLDVEQAVDYVLQAARGLAFAHGEGVIHRDIKPANLLLDKKGVVKILDMGLARIESSDEGLTATEQVMGTVDYMSPEQAASTKGADSRADIYSLGCTLWFLLTGKKLYEADTMISRLMAHRDGPLPSLVKARDDAPWPLEQAFHKMIAKRADDRFQSMDEVISALSPFGGGGSPSGIGSSIGMGSNSQNAELASFLKSVGPGAKPQGKGTSSTTNFDFEATQQFDKPDVDTDPKSEMLPAPKRSTGAKPLANGSAVKKPLNKMLLIAGAGGAALLALLGAWFAFRGGDGPDVVSGVGSLAGVVPAEPKPTGVGPAGFPQAPVAGVSGYALELNEQGFLQSDAFEGQVFEPPLTIEGLFKHTGNWPAQAPLLTLYGQLGLLLNSAGNRVILEYGNHQIPTEPYFRFQTESVVELDRTVHLAAVWTGERVLFFSDGRLTASQATKPRTARPALDRIFSGRFNGTIDEIRVSRAARYEQDFTPASRFESDIQTLALYHCDDGVGGLLTDASGNHMHAEVQGGKWIKSSLVAPPQAVSPTSIFATAPSSAVLPQPGDYALKFEGDGVVEFHEVLDYAPNSCTIEAYVRPDAYVPKAFVYSITDQNGLGLEFGDGKRWRLSHVMAQGGHFQSHSSTPAELGKRVHVAGVCDQSQFRLYVDGKLVGSPSNGTPEFASAKNRPLIGSLFQGVIDELRISKKPRYASDFTPATRHEPDADTLALYHFDEGAGNVLNDASGNKLHGWIDRAKWIRADGSPTQSSTPPPSIVSDAALEFDGLTGEIVIPNLRRDGGPFTLECRVQNASSKIMPIIRVNGRAPIQLHLANRMPHGAERTADDKVGRDLYGPALATNRWTHLAYVVDVDESRLFVDGKLAKKQSGPPAIAPTTKYEGTWIGSERLGGYSARYEGKVDEIRISSTARYVGDFEPLQRFEPDANTVALYHCDQNTSDILHDSSGNRHDGKIVGAKWVQVAEGTANASATEIDLLAGVDVTRDAVVGTFTLTGGLKPVVNVKNPRIYLPAVAPAEYDLAITAERTAPAGLSLMIGFPWQGHQGSAVVDGYGAIGSGLEMIDGKNAHDNGTFKLGERITAGTTHEIVVRVRKEGVAATCDGVALFDWKGKPEQLSTHAMWDVPRKDQFFIGFQGPYVVRAARLKPVNLPDVRNALETKGIAPPMAVAPFDAAQAKAHQEAWAKHLGTEVETINSVGAKLVLIPPGEFMMGSTDEKVEAALKVADEISADLKTKEGIKSRIKDFERPSHLSHISKSFQIGATEVTVGQFKAFVSATGYQTEAESARQFADNKTYTAPGYEIANDFPASVITFNDAIAFCKWLSDQERATYRLPTEAEWEFACRAGTTSSYCFGDEFGRLEQFGWYKSNSGSGSQSVGTKQANFFGLYDVHGNVQEWCQSSNDGYQTPPVTAIAQSPTAYMVRGGHWYSYAVACRSSHRPTATLPHYYNLTGFRLVREPAAPSTTSSITPQTSVTDADELARSLTDRQVSVMHCRGKVYLLKSGRRDVIEVQQGQMTVGSTTGGATTGSSIQLGDKAKIMPNSTINTPTTGGATTGGATTGGATVGGTATGGAGTGGTSSGSGGSSSGSGSASGSGSGSGGAAGSGS